MSQPQPSPEMEHGEPDSISANPDPATNPTRGRRFQSLLNRVRRALFRKVERDRKQRKAMLILNPASGQGTPDLRVINRILKDAGFTWEVNVTNGWGDGAKLARKAIRSGSSLVAAYGGDGTIMDVAAGMVGSDTPLAILPGGTGNALAKELGLPFELEAACSLMAEADPCVRRIDLGRANKHLFLLRFGVGLEAEIVRTADRSLKDRLGLFAYVSATVQALSQAAISRYCLSLDGKTVEIEGLACMVANAATLGIQGVNISPRVRIDDGLLDVFVIRRADLAELASFARSMIGASSPYDSLPHWQCRSLHVEAQPRQGIQADGEELGHTPVTVQVLPGALGVIVPRV